MEESNMKKLILLALIAMMLIGMVAFSACKAKVEEEVPVEEVAPMEEAAPVDTVQAPVETAPVTP